MTEIKETFLRYAHNYIDDPWDRECVICNDCAKEK